MTVLITGAGGFLGNVILRHLENGPDCVRVAARDPGRMGARHDTVALPPPDAPDGAFHLIMKDVTHVVHCASLNNDAQRATLGDFMSANATLTARLAETAAAVVPGRFVLLSSIRAVVGADHAGTIDERTDPNPSCFYGRSKRAAELEAAARYTARGRGDLAILRLPPAYGDGMKGYLAALMRLSDTPVPLPFAGLTGGRPVVSSDAVARAVAHLLDSNRNFDQSAYVASDARPVTIPGIISAYRRGFDHRRRLFSAPSALLAAAAALIGGRHVWETLSVTQICDPSALAATGWDPEPDSLARLENLARSRRESRVGDLGG